MFRKLVDEWVNGSVSGMNRTVHANGLNGCNGWVNGSVNGFSRLVNGLNGCNG